MKSKYKKNNMNLIFTSSHHVIPWLWYSEQNVENKFSLMIGVYLVFTFSNLKYVALHILLNRWFKHRKKETTWGKKLGEKNWYFLFFSHCLGAEGYLRDIHQPWTFLSNHTYSVHDFWFYVVWLYINFSIFWMTFFFCQINCRDSCTIFMPEWTYVKKLCSLSLQKEKDSEDETK